MILQRSLLVLTLALFAVLGLHSEPAFAKGPGPGTKAVKAANETISKLLKKKVAANSPEEKALSSKVTASLRGFLDVDALGKSSLSKHWSTLSEAQRSEFLSLLRSLIESKYIDGLRANLEYSVTYTAEVESSAEKRLVKTEITATRRGRPHNIAVDYLVTAKGKSWQAVDVITDGVGLVENYRAQFNSIIGKKGFDGLLALMRKRHSASK